MLTVITSIVGFLGSTAGGALFGWLGALGNRYFDLQIKKLELEREKIRGEYDLKQLGLELEGRTRVASVEGEAKVEAAAYNALAASYAADKASYGIVWVDAIRGAIRPLLTIVFVILVVRINGEALALLKSRAVTVESLMSILDWVMFQASVVIGWWFGTRPSRK